jgi:molybdopterin molybdotransferase
MVKPFILRTMGCNQEPMILNLPAGADIKRKRSSRKVFIPVKIENGKVFPIDYHGSAHINAYTKADGLIAVEPGKPMVVKGEMTDVRFL